MMNPNHLKRTVGKMMNDMERKRNLEKIKVVMGWDIGDGDTAGYSILISDGKCELAALAVHTSRDLQVEKSVVARTPDGTIVIGEDATKHQDFAINFKRAPGSWHCKSPGQDVEYRQHMFNFIRGVSEAILKNSKNRNRLQAVMKQDEKGDMHWNKDEVLLVVGCPASVIWKGRAMRQQYEKLISEATGIRNVIVTEESKAAVFSVFKDDFLREKIDLQKGVLVLDLGSSTADATYILPGKKEINMSWELGAKEIEEAMLDYIVHSRKAKEWLGRIAKAYDKNRLIVVQDKSSKAVFELRLEKEAFFDGKLGGNKTTQNVWVPIIDEDGDPIPDGISLPYCVTEEMMQYAMDGYVFEVKKNGEVISQGTWRQNCRKFFEDVRLKLEKEKVPVGAVIITGGGSNMPFTVEMGKAVFSGSWVVPSATPSHSVVKGLATIAYNEVKAPALRQKVKGEIEAEGKKNIDKMVDSITDNLSAKAYDDAVSALAGMTYRGNGLTDKLNRFFDFDSNVGDITRRVQRAINDSLARNVDVVIKNGLTEWKDADNSVIVNRVNRAAKELYADEVISNMVKISMVDVSVISKNLSLPNISMPDIAKNANFIGAIVGYILSVVLFVVLGFIAALVPGIGPIFTVVAGAIGSEILIDKLKSWEGTPVSGTCIAKAVRKMKDQKNEKLKEIRTPVREKIYEALTKPDAYGKDFEKHNKVLLETAEKAFDRILLETDGENN